MAGDTRIQQNHFKTGSRNGSDGRERPVYCVWKVWERQECCVYIGLRAALGAAGILRMGIL